MACTACGRYAACANPYLPGYGAGRVLVVDSGPSSKDDMAAAVHTGLEGDLLRSLLADAGFVPEDLAYAPALRCGVKRPAIPQEIDACRPLLAADIARVRPEVIVALGDVALRSLTKLGGIKTKRGGSYPLHPSFQYTCEVYPTYAPFNVTKSPYLRTTILSDLRRVRDSATPEPKIPWSWWEPGNTGLLLEETPTVGFDIETDYDPKTKTGGDNIIQCAISTVMHTWVGYGENALLLARQLEDYKGVVYTLNGWKYDNPKCKALGILIPHGIDVMALAYLDDESQSLALESLAVKYLKVRGWKDLHTATPGSPEFAHYNAKDSHYTLRLAAELENILALRKSLVTYVMAPARQALDAAATFGIPLRRDSIRDAKQRYTESLERARNIVVQLSGNPQHNPNAAREVAAVLHARGYILPATPSGQAATSKGLLQRLDDEYSRALLDYRGAKKALSTYILPYDLAAQTSGRIFTEYTIWRTKTGRTSSRNENIQNLPRNLDFFNVTSFDYSAIEFRLAAWLANDETILIRFQENPNWDPHRYFASLFYQIEEAQVTAHQRQVAKSANFSQLYIGNGHTIQKYARGLGIELSAGTCHRLHHQWHTAFPAFNGGGNLDVWEVGGFYKRTLDEIRATGYVQTATGFRRHFGDLGLVGGPALLAALREAVNCKVQTLACHIALLGFTENWRQGLPQCGFIHDSNLFDFRNVKMGVDTKEQINYNMTVTPVHILRDQFGVNLTVPLIVEVKYPK